MLQSGTPGKRFEDLFSRIGIATTKRLTISSQRELREKELAGADGLFVCGGVNPLYQSALASCFDTIRHLVASGLPYAGFSAAPPRRS